MFEKEYLRFKTSSDKQYVMFKLIKLLVDCEQEKNIDIELLYNIYFAIYSEELVCLNRDLQEIEQVKWSTFDKLLKKAPKDWFRNTETDEEYKHWLTEKQRKISKKIYETLTNSERDGLDYIYIKMLEQPLIHTNVLEELNCIMLSQEAEDFLVSYRSKGNDQQNVEQSIMAEIIKILRSTKDPIADKLYSLIRSSVAAKNMEINLKTKRVKPHFLTELEYISLKNEIEELILEMEDTYMDSILSLFEDLHNYITGPADIKYCKVCGNPVWGNECVGGILCSTKLKTGEEQYSVKSIDTGEIVYYLKDGIIRFNSIPGIDELWLYKNLINRYKDCDFVKINIYPGKDAEGDIEVVIGDKQRILIDVKGWRKSWMLEEKISKNASVFKNTDYLFVPVTLKSFYTNGLEGINKTLKKNNLKTKAVTDRQLFKRINDEIYKYNEDLKTSKMKSIQKQISFL